MKRAIVRFYPGSPEEAEADPGGWIEVDQEVADDDPIVVDREECFE